MTFEAPSGTFISVSNLTNSPSPSKFKRLCVTLIATGLGSGFTPKAPGTAGTVIGILLVLAVAPLSWVQQSVGFAILLAIGWWASLHWSRSVQSTDSQKIVIDEILGYWIAMWMLPVTPTVIITQFVVFRLFDSIKPPPIRQLDQWGKRFNIGPAQSFMVIFDDLLAGLASWALYVYVLEKWISTY